jgi:hypothetical protein
MPVAGRPPLAAEVCAAEATIERRDELIDKPIHPETFALQ